MRETLIGVDIAVNKTGVVVMDGSKLTRTEIVEFKPSQKYPDKVGGLYSHFSTLFYDILPADNPVLVLEGRLKAGFSGNTLASIEGARIAVHLAYRHVCQQLGISAEVVEYSPHDVKQFFTGKRGAKKEELHKRMRTRFPGLSVVKYQEDIYDAIALCLFHQKGAKGVGKQKKPRNNNSRNRAVR